ncbi:MAG: ABC transporter permease [Thermoguttaceae bacterium]|jgi:putative ABC transport system permease protein
MNMFSLAWKNLRRRPARSFLTVIGLSVAVAVVVSLVGLSQSLESSFLALYTRRGADLVVQRRGGTVQLAKGLPLKLADRIEKMPGVKEVIRGLMDMVAFETQGLFMVIVNGWEADCPVLDRVQITAGRRLQKGDHRRVMLGRILAANLGKRPGDSVEIYSQQFEVVGIFDSFSVYESGAVFMLMEELQQQMDRPGQATGFVVQVTPAGDARVIERVRRDIEALDPAIAATPCAEFVRSLKQMQVTRAMSWVAAVIAALIGAIGVLNTMAMSVLERRSEIGAFRAMGWRKRLVVQLIVTESLLLATVGAMLGTALGLSVLSGLSHSRATSGLVQGDWPISAILEGTLLAFLMAAIGAVWPALRVTAEQPVETLLGR